GATISNNSWGGSGFDQALNDAIAAAATHDHLFIAAAGNSTNNNDILPFYPAGSALDNVIAVAATDSNDHLASFSNYGATTVDLGAPGGNILSTALRSGPLSDPSGYMTLSGTSMATPHVTGVAALLRGLHPTWTFQQIKDQILGTVDPIPALDGLTVSGRRLNAAAPLPRTRPARASPPPARPPPPPAPSPASASPSTKRSTRPASPRRTSPASRAPAVRSTSATPWSPSCPARATASSTSTSPRSPPW